MTALSNSILNMAKTPAYQSAFLFEFGQNYDDAKQKGADDGKALVYSVFTSGLNAAVEMGGGAESLPYGTKMGISDVLLSSLGEGGEEILQDGISNVLDWAITDSDKPLFSTTDENAVFNPSRSGKAGLMGMVAGMVLGGGGAVLNNINTAGESKVNNQYGEIVTNEQGIVDSESVQAVINEGLANDNPEIRKIAAQLNAKDNVTAEEAGYLYRRLVASSAHAQTDNSGATSTMQSERLFHDAKTPDYMGAVALLRANMSELQNMESVASVTGTELSGNGRGTERAASFWKK